MLSMPVRAAGSYGRSVGTLTLSPARIVHMYVNEYPFPGPAVKTSTTRARAFALILSVLFILPHSLAAQAKPRVLLDTLVGFNGVVRQGRFAPVIVSVATPGSRLVGQVRVEVIWGSSLRGTQESRVFQWTDTFAAGGLKRLPFIVPVPPEARALQVTVTAGAETLAEADVDLRSAATPDRLVAAVSSTLSLDSLTGMSTTGNAVRVVYPRLDDLPDAWGGYDGLEMVVVHDTYFRQLRESQVSALQRWVVSGGVVVFTGGAGGLQHANAGFADMLPVEVTGLAELTAVPELAALTGQTAGPRGKTEVAVSRLTAGDVVAERDGVPLVVRRPLGQGTVWFLAMDPTVPPFTGWPGTLALWQLMDGRHRTPALTPSSRGPAEDQWMSALMGSPPMGFPAQLGVLLFSACYILLFVAVSLGGRRLRLSPALRPVLMAAVPLAACAAGWFLFNSMLFRPEPLLVDASVARMRSGDDLALVTEKVGLFASRPGVAGITFASPDVLIDELVPYFGIPRKQGQSAAPLVVSQGTPGAGASVPGLSIGRFGSRLIAASGVSRLPISLSLTPEGDSYRLRVVNASSAWLRGTFFLLKDDAWAVGDMAPGSTRSLLLPAAAEGGPTALLRATGGYRVINFWNLVSSEAGAGNGTLAAWLDSPSLGFTVSGARRAPGRPPLSLLLVEAP